MPDFKTSDNAIAVEQLTTPMQSFLAFVREAFDRDGEFPAIVFAKKSGYDDLFCVVVAPFMGSHNHVVKSALVSFAQAGAEVVGLVSEGWAVWAHPGDKATMEAAYNSELHQHPDRIEVLTINFETREHLYLFQAHIVDKKLEPWEGLIHRYEDFRRETNLQGIRFQGIFDKALASGG